MKLYFVGSRDEISSKHNKLRFGYRAKNYDNGC